MPAGKMDGGLRPRSFFVLMLRMGIGSTGFDHHKARAANARHRAQLDVASWCAGRRHLSDDIDHALAMLLRRDGLPEGAARGTAAKTLKEWLAANPHLPADLVAAIHVMMPEVGQGNMANDWPVG